MKIGVIGSSGRGALAQRMSRPLYFAMVNDAHQLLDQARIRDDEIVELVSGGSAWADHVAVSLYLKGVADSLTLYLPCGYDAHQHKFIGPRGWLEGDAWVLNQRHDVFGLVMGRDPRLGIEDAVARGAQLVTVVGGFLGRNLEVGRVDWLIAYTWDGTPEPQSPGTGHTWRHSGAARKTHRDLSRLAEGG